MFKKIVSNLPYHPVVLEQVSFYARRLRQEDSIRRAGLIFTALVIALQVFVIISPSKPSLATSANDIIYGANSKDQVLQAYNDNRDALGRTDIQAIYNHYGIGSAQIAASTYQRIGSQEKSFISTGRGTSPGIDTFIPIEGTQEGGIYERNLTNWDTNGQQNWYDSLTGMSSFGFRFWVLTSGCGNIVFEKNSLTPNLNIVKQALSGSETTTGSQMKYSIQFQNTGPGTAENLTINDKLPSEFEYVTYSSNADLHFSLDNQSLSWRIANPNSELPPSQRWYGIEITVKVRDVSSPKRVCNWASIVANQVVAKQATDESRCVNIVITTCPGTGLPMPAAGVGACQVSCPDGSTIAYNQSCSQPQLACHYLSIIGSPTWNSRKFETAIVVQTGAAAKQINYYVNNSLVGTLPFVSGQLSQLYTYEFPSGEGTYNVKAELQASSGTVQPSQGCQLIVTITKPINPQPRISTDKSVENLTQNITDANGTTAKAGDKLKYTIYISNSGDANYDNLKLDGEYGESINDILEYSTIVDQGDASYNNKTHFLSWASVNVPAGTTVKKSFTVQVKDPLPATPTSSSDPLSFDFNMQNKYGRLTVIHLKKPVTKIVEQSVKELPNTGPGSSLTICLVAVIIVGYFFYRSRLLTRELAVVQHSFSAGGL